MKHLVSILAISALASSSAMASPKDGELTFPADYKSWPVFVGGIEKKKNFREIYINPTGAAAKKGEALPNGSQFVMEIYKKTDGKKGDLKRIFVMAKDAGWGANAPEGLGNGDWIYSGFKADGTPSKSKYNKCRSCHTAHAKNDYVILYDKFFK